MNGGNTRLGRVRRCMRDTGYRYASCICSRPVRSTHKAIVGKRFFLFETIFIFIATESSIAAENI